MSIEDGMFKIDKDNYSELYDLAEIIISTKSIISKSGSAISTPEVSAAKALQQQIDQAIEDKVEYLLFTENEVQFLASVVS